jgi:hypothetical protein
MTNRTASLLMLFVVALGSAGVLLAMAVAALDRTAVSGPWLAPVVAGACQAVVLYLGRGYILPDAVAQRPGRAAVTIVSMVALTLAAAVGAVWTMRWASGVGAGASTLTLVVWFSLLWCAMQHQQKWHRPLKNGVR